MLDLDTNTHAAGKPNTTSLILYMNIFIKHFNGSILIIAQSCMHQLPFVNVVLLMSTATDDCISIENDSSSILVTADLPMMVSLATVAGLTIICLSRPQLTDSINSCMAADVDVSVVLIAWIPVP